MSAEPQRSVSVADLKAHASELLREVQGGEVIEITRRGEPVATLNPVRRQRIGLDLAWLQEQTLQMPVQDEDSGSFVQRMREADRA